MHYGMGAGYYLVMHYEYEMGLMHHLDEVYYSVMHYGMGAGCYVVMHYKMEGKRQGRLMHHLG
jgi:hypothetical protein